MTVHKPNSTLSRVANIVGSTKLEIAQGSYLGLILREGVTAYILLSDCILGGLPHARVTKGDEVWDYGEYGSSDLDAWEWLP